GQPADAAAPPLGRRTGGFVYQTGPAGPEAYYGKPRNQQGHPHRQPRRRPRAALHRQRHGRVQLQRRHERVLQGPRRQPRREDGVAPRGRVGPPRRDLRGVPQEGPAGLQRGVAPDAAVGGPGGSDPLPPRDQGARDADARRARRLGRRVRLRPVPLAGAPAPPAASAAAACAPAACAAARRVGGRRPLVHAGRRPPLLAAPVAQRRGGALRGAAPPAFRPCAAEAPRRVYSRRRRVEPTPSPLDPASSTALAGPPVPALADALALPAAALTLLAEMGPAG